jgi:hypothetical protein
VSKNNLPWSWAGVAGLAALVLTAACNSGVTPTPTPAPAAGVVLFKILGDCWGVKELKDLDGTRPDHVRAFECARRRLLEMGEQYPEAAEPHRVLAWGYLYALKDEAAAQAEYERAAEIYAQQGHPVEQADILVRIAVQLTMQHDRRSGCNLLSQAAGLDPANSRVPVLLRNFDCIPRTVIPPTTITPTAGNPVTATPNSAPTPEPTNATP